MITVQTRYEPGGFVPFDGRGSSMESNSEALNWAIASGGIVQQVKRVPMSSVVFYRGRGPYVRCAASGYMASVEYTVKVDGLTYIEDFAPTPREEF